MSQEQAYLTLRKQGYTHDQAVSLINFTQE
jgi:hypothetical protein